MTGSSNEIPPRRATLLCFLLVLVVIGFVWYYFLGPGVQEPWPWEVLRRGYLDWRGR